MEWKKNIEEPKDLDRQIVIYHPDFRDKIIICDKYNPNDKNFYYYDDGCDSPYQNIPLNYKDLMWIYLDELLPKEFTEYEIKLNQF